MDLLHIIDVSSAQTGILPSTVDCDGAMVKTTGGTNYVNPAADPVLQDLFNSNKAAGIYHYAHEYGQYHPSEEEVRYFLDNSKGYIGKAILALDYEEPINGSTFTQADVRWCAAFIKQVIDETGIVPLLYCSKGLLTQLNWQPVADLNVGGWIAQYANNNYVGWDNDPWTDNKGFGAIVPVMYQYTSHGRISGWNADLDLNIFYGNREAWNKFAHTGENQDQNTGSELKEYLKTFADDVINGEYGNGDERKNNIYNAVQNAVNQRLNK